MRDLEKLKGLIDDVSDEIERLDVKMFDSGLVKDYEKQVKIMYVADAEKTNQLENELKIAKTTFEQIWDKFSRSECNYAGLKDDRNALSLRIDRLMNRIDSLEKHRHEVKAVSETYDCINRWTDRILTLEKKFQEFAASIADEVIIIGNKKIDQGEVKRLNVVVEHIDNHKDRIDILEKRARSINSRFDRLMTELKSMDINITMI